jgi:hypothetical protein
MDLTFEPNGWIIRTRGPYPEQYRVQPRSDFNVFRLTNINDPSNVFNLARPTYYSYIGKSLTGGPDDPDAEYEVVSTHINDLCKSMRVNYSLMRTRHIIEKIIFEQMRGDDTLAQQLNQPQMDLDGLTPIEYACLNGIEGTAVDLYETGMIDPFRPNANNQTLLQLACRQSMEELALNILDSSSPDCSHSDNNGFTALMLACWNSLDNVALKILDTGTSRPGKQSLSGLTALIISCERGMNDTAMAIFETGESRPELMESGGGFTAINMLIYNGHIDTPIFRELAKYFLFVEPNDQYFLNSVAPILCTEPTHDLVVASFQRDPQLAGVDLSPFCFAPVPTLSSHIDFMQHGTHSSSPRFLRMAKGTRHRKRSASYSGRSTRRLSPSTMRRRGASHSPGTRRRSPVSPIAESMAAQHIPVATAAIEEVPEYYMDAYGIRRLIPPVISMHPGVRIPKRGGKSKKRRGNKTKS